MVPMLLVLQLWFHLWFLNAQAAEFPGVYQLTEPLEHSECPTWDSRNNVLYFVDSLVGQIYRYDYDTKHLKHITLKGEVSPVIPSARDPNLLIAGLTRSVVAVEWDGESHPSETRILTTVSTQFPGSRLNDGKADKQGRLWIGSMGSYGADGLAPNEGVFYKVTCENLNSPEVEIAPVNISNGLAFNAANDKLYYIDSPTGQVVEYSYDDANGTISDKRVVFDRANYENVLVGDPDGMTIDENDNLWVALYGGGAIIHVNSTDGTLLREVPLPALQVSSAIWGGPDLDILYVTTSRLGLTDQQKMEQPAAGAVFAVVGLGTRGRPVFAVDILGSIDDESCGTESFWEVAK